MHCLYAGVYQGNEAALKDLDCWRNKQIINNNNKKTPQPKTKQKEKSLEKNCWHLLPAIPFGFTTYQ